MAASTTILDGVFAVNKPVGMSSAQVIRDCQQHFNPSSYFKPMLDQQRNDRGRESNTKKKRRGFGKNDIRVKIGHGGTLDPLATGVLILGVGKGTKSLQAFLDCTKTYETVVLFGASTDTYDRVGKVLKKTAYDHITRPMVEEAMKGFRGKFQQMPPLYSALKMEGKPLYEYAREGKPIPREITTREVNVSDLELVEWYEPGTHNHRWPAEDATTFERNFAEQVWKIEKDQMTKEKRTPEQEEEEQKALERHETFKRKADENVDALVYDKVNKRRKVTPKEPLMMSGALGEHPPLKGGKGSNLVPPPHNPDTPPPWDDKGPPAARIRMTVTSGFYVRSFCHDLGVKIGSSAVMAELCRSRQGDFELGTPNCLEYDDIMKGEETWAPQVEEALKQWNDKSSTTRADPPIRAKPVESPKHAQQSIETSPSDQKHEPSAETTASPKKRKSASPNSVSPAAKKRKSSVEPARSSPKKEKSASPKSTLPSKGETTIGGTREVKINGKVATENEEEWNGFADDKITSKH